MTTVDGQERKGRLVASGAGSLELVQSEGVITLPLVQVRKIEAPDRLDNGARWGALAGGIALGVEAYHAFLNSSERSGAPRAALFFGGIGAGLGALGGALVDSFIEGRRVLYRAPGTAALTIAPLVGRKNNGVRAQLTW